MAAPRKLCRQTLLATPFASFCRPYTYLLWAQRFHVLSPNSTLILHTNGRCQKHTAQHCVVSSQLNGHDDDGPGPGPLYLARCLGNKLQGYLSHFHTNSHLFANHTNGITDLGCRRGLCAVCYGSIGPHPAGSWIWSMNSVRGYRNGRGRGGVSTSGDVKPHDLDGGYLRTAAEQNNNAWRSLSLLIWAGVYMCALSAAFLSWTRNSYIMTIAGVTIYCQDSVAYSQEAGVVMLLAAGLKVATGTSLYLYSLLTRRRRMAMSFLGAATLGGLSVAHLLLWIGALMIYLGYVDDLDDPTLLDELEKELKKEIAKDHHLKSGSRRSTSRPGDKSD